MRAVLAWLTASPLNATVAAAALGVMPLGLLPLTQIASGGVIALVALKQGVARGALVSAGALGLIALLGWLLGRDPVAAMAMVLGFWLGVLLLGAVLRHTASLPLTVQIGTLLAMAGVAAFMFGVADPEAYWRGMLETLLQPTFEQLRAAGREGQIEALLAMARLMTGAVMASAVLSIAGAVMLGRWAQGVLDNPGGFGRDFRAWRNGRVATLVASLVFLAGVLLQSTLLENLALALLPMLLFQGLALAHFMVHRLQWHTGWLVGLYALFLPLSMYLVSVLAIAGFLDEFFDFRAWVARMKQDR